MPMPKPKSESDLCIGANGLDNQAGRTPKKLDIKVQKVTDPAIVNNMAALAQKARAEREAAKND